MQATYLNHYLTDTDVANFARQSFGAVASSFTQVQNDSLVRFLARGMTSGNWEELLIDLVDVQTHGDAHNMATYLRKIPEHWVPFGHPHITLKMCAPVPIRVQAFKHKIGFVESEESRRYIKTRPIVHVPEVFRAAAPSVKQGSSGAHRDSEAWREIYLKATNNMVEHYMAAVDDGICPEQARFFLPQGTEVNWVWTGSLYAFANFYNQRINPHAQREIQELAAQVGNIIAPLYPVSWSALTQGNY